MVITDIIVKLLTRRSVSFIFHVLFSIDFAFIHYGETYQFVTCMGLGSLIYPKVVIFTSHHLSLIHLPSLVNMPFRLMVQLAIDYL
jgi:hypothetical protein